MRIALGTDAGVYPHGQNGGELPLLVEAGMRPADALRAGTVWAAELLGVDDRLGALEPGKLADVIAVAGDPVADIGRMQGVLFVMKEGVVSRNDLARPER